MIATQGNMVRVQPIESSMAVAMSTLVPNGMEPRGNITFIVLDKQNQVWWCTLIPVHGKLKQEEPMFVSSLAYAVRAGLRKGK